MLTDHEIGEICDAVYDIAQESEVDDSRWSPYGGFATLHRVLTEIRDRLSAEQQLRINDIMSHMTGWKDEV